MKFKLADRILSLKEKKVFLKRTNFLLFTGKDRWVVACYHFQRTALELHLLVAQLNYGHPYQ